MSAEHTSGPWSLAERPLKHYAASVVSAGGECVADVCDHGVYDRDAECAANARVIAAAPELLEALRDINARINALMEEETLENAATPSQWGELCALLDISAAPIAKATGAQP